MCQAVQDQTESTKNLKKSSEALLDNCNRVTQLVKRIDELPDIRIEDILGGAFMETIHEA